MRKKLKLMKKPSLWREALVIFAACALVFGTAAGLLYGVRKNYMRLYLMEDAKDTMEDVEDNFSEIRGVYGNGDSENAASDESVYMSAYERLMTCDEMNTSIGDTDSDYEAWVYADEDAGYNYLYRLYDYESMEEIDISPYVGNPELTAVMYVTCVETGKKIRFVCDDDELAAALAAEVGVREGYTDTEEVLDELRMNIESLYIDGSRFSLNFSSDTGREYDGPADTSGYEKYDAEMKTVYSDSEELYVTFVMDGSEYYVENIVVYTSLEDSLTDEAEALDYMAQSGLAEELKQTTARSITKVNLDAYNEDSVYSPEMYRAGNAACGKPYVTDREYAAMAVKVTLANGDTCILLGVCSYDLNASIAKLAGNMAKEAAAATFVLAALLTVVVYIPRKSRYDRQEFRRSMTSAMVHDLKTPLMAMSGCAENLAANINTDKREQYARTICENVQKLSGMIDRMLDVDRYEGKSLKTAEQADMAELAKQVITENMEAAERRNMTVTCSGSYVVNADSEAMKCILENLVTNAIRYGSEGGVIDIEMDETGMTVSNTIDSAPEGDLSSLWKPYVKGSSARENGGSGLGLFLVKNILDGCGLSGEIAADDGKFIVRISG